MLSSHLHTGRVKVVIVHINNMSQWEDPLLTSPEVDPFRKYHHYHH